jgi:hypothetical protein
VFTRIFLFRILVLVYLKAFKHNKDGLLLGHCLTSQKMNRGREEKEMLGKTHVVMLDTVPDSAILLHCAKTSVRMVTVFRLGKKLSIPRLFPLGMTQDPSRSHC